MSTVLIELSRFVTNWTMFVYGSDRFVQNDISSERFTPDFDRLDNSCKRFARILIVLWTIRGVGSTGLDYVLEYSVVLDNLPTVLNSSPITRPRF